MTRILLIEDDQFLSDALAAKLRLEGYEVATVSDGAEGLREISALKPDLILLDIILPTMNGYEILEAKRKDPAIASIPVIVLSNSGQPVEISRVLALGVKDYLVKAQFDPEEVIEKIHGMTPQDAAAGGLSRLAGKKILLVEDDSLLSDLMREKLVHEGAAASCARSAEEALKILETEAPDVMLIDLILPGMSGFDLIKAVKTGGKAPQARIIVMSNLGQESNVVEVEKSGVDKYLVKADHDPDEIIEEIAKALK